MGDRVAIPVSGPERHETTTAWWTPYALQWAGGVLTLPIAALAHGMWGDDLGALPWITVAMSLVGAGLTVATYLITSVKAYLRLHATLTVAAGVLWLTSATIAGPVSSPLIDMWLMMMPAITGSWTVRKLVGKGQRSSSGEGGDSKLFDSVRLSKTKIKGEIEVAPNRVTAQLQLPAGKLTADDVTAAKGRLASALSVGNGAVRVAPDPDHHDQATLTVVPQDMLKEALPWPGPSSVGGSIAEPLNIGVYEDGFPQHLWLPGDVETHRNATMVLVMGMNGSGKSFGAKVAWTEILTRHDAKLWLADGAKGLQTVGAFAPYVDWCAPSVAEATKMLEVLPDVIQARASALGELGLEQWVAGCGMPLLVVWVEEAPRILREDDEYITDIVQTARSAGVILVLSIQRPSYRQISVDTRNQMGAVWCFGVKETADAAFALDEALLDAGADPSVWKNRRPGYNYLEAPGIDEDRMVSRARTWKIENNNDLIAAVADFDPHHVDLGDVTANAAGTAYRTRTRYTLDQHGKPVPLPPGAAPHRTAASENPVAVASDDGDSDENTHELLQHAAELVIRSQFGSTSMLQRKLRINHADSTTLMAQLEAIGVVGAQPEDLDQPRPVLVTPDELDDVMATHDTRTPRPVRPGIHGRLTAADETDEAMALPENPDPGLGDIDPDTVLPPVDPGQNFDLPTTRPTTEQAVAALAARLAEIRATGATQVRPKDIGKDFFDTVRTRPWVSARLSQMAMAGDLVETDVEGVYLFPNVGDAAA